MPETVAHYRIVRLLHAGGIPGPRQSSCRQVALKVLPPAMAQGQELTRFKDHLAGASMGSWLLKLLAAVAIVLVIACATSPTQTGGSRRGCARWVGAAARHPDELETARLGSYEAGGSFSIEAGSQPLGQDEERNAGGPVNREEHSAIVGEEGAGICHTPTLSLPTMRIRPFSVQAPSAEPT